MATRGSWRRLLRAWHRDLGYFVTALTLGYAISGVAVNHADAWNPNVQIVQRDIAVGPLPTPTPSASDLTRTDFDGFERHLITALDLDPAELKGRLHSGVDEFTLFLRHGGEVKVQISTGRGRLKQVTPRYGLFELNMLHLNHLKGAWTWIADLFALFLGFLALSGVVMLKGRNGLLGRGKWWIGGGLVVPVAAVVAYYF